MINITGSSSSPNIVDGSVTNPSIKFLTDGDVGLYREGTNSLGLAINSTAAGRLNTSGLFLTNDLRVGAGTRPLPSLSFHNDEDTGIFRQGVGSMGFSAQAREIMRIDANGVVISGLGDAAGAIYLLKIAESSDGLNSQCRLLYNNQGALSLTCVGQDNAAIGFDIDKVNTWPARYTSWALLYKNADQFQFMGNTGSTNGVNVAALNIMGYFNLANSGLLLNGVLTCVKSGLKVNSTVLMETTVALADGAGASTGTLTNAPAGTNPTKWIPINDNSVIRYIPCW